MARRRNSTILVLWLLSILQLILLQRNVVVVAADETDNMIHSLSNELQFDENDRLLKHTAVYLDSPSCRKEHLPHIKGDHWDVFALGQDSPARNEIFPDKIENYCQLACIERGVDRSLVGALMPTRVYDPVVHKEFGTAKRWLDHSCNKVEVCFINYHDRSSTIKTNWINFQGKPQPHLDDLEYGERGTRCFVSFMGHKFEALDQDDNVLETFEVKSVGVKAFGAAYHNRILSSSDARRNFTDEIRTTLRHEWVRHERVTRTFSPLGFKKGKLPRDVFASMGAFYYNNRGNIVNEEWGGKGVFVNWWETDVMFVQIPWSLKKIWQLRLLELVQDWAGVPVEQTVMYGLRQYTEGARLLSHVDRHETHAVSLIVNVAQGNLTEPWPVEVQDHRDRLHEVIMEPGDIVYYESAKCLHARNRPLVGPNAYYVNLFTHYKPVTDLTWWDQPNHDGTPDPVLESEGNCKKQTSVEGIEGYNVQCEDKRLGMNLSPTLFRANNADDMIRWWVETSPKEEDESSDVSEEEPEAAPFVAIENPSRDEL